MDGRVLKDAIRRPHGLRVAQGNYYLVDAGGRMKMWSAKEDKVLIDCLLTLKVEQKWMADNGFKAGFANALQSMMEQKLPGCGIKATPHITSRIKTLKRLWQLAYDMVYGPNTSGFGWDPDTKFVTAEPAVWEEYLKAHPRCSHFRTKTIPNFDTLCIVWGKDRAIGDEGRSPGGMEEDVALEDDDLPETPTTNAADSEFSPTMPDIGDTQIPPTDANKIQGKLAEVWTSSAVKYTSKNDWYDDYAEAAKWKRDLAAKEAKKQKRVRKRRDSDNASGDEPENFPNRKKQTR
ncbi:hypothetical protein K1719_013920 [Acacia pycnantha]|nr:hypothetical protein K1719_013920 [Acacia pycnantha]